MRPILRSILVFLVGNSATAGPLSIEIPPPEGYHRVAVAERSYAEYLRNLPLKPPGSPVYYFDGTIVSGRDQSSRVVGLDFLFQTDLEQCADMAYRLRSEFLLQTGAYASIDFRLQNGQSLRWPKWRDGHRIRFNALSKKHDQYHTPPDSSRQSFNQFLGYLFLWSGSVAIKSYSKHVEESELQPGDMIVQNTTGAMGHVSVILDICVNSNGERLYLIGNGWTPAQNFFVRKPADGEGADWWFTLKGYEKHLRGYHFGPLHFRRF